jgi:hypothetical protein
VLICATIPEDNDVILKRLLPSIAVGALSNLPAADLTGSWAGTMETNGNSNPDFVDRDPERRGCDRLDLERH